MVEARLFRPFARSEKITLSDQDIQLCTQLFAKIRNATRGLTPVQYFHPQLVSDIIDEDFTREIRSEIREHKEKTEVEYSDIRNFTAYDVIYFYRNLLKYIVVSVYLQKRTLAGVTYDNLVDIGAGAGTFSVAWLSVAAELKREGPKTVLVNDNAHFQQSLAIDYLSKLFDLGILGSKKIVVPLYGDFRRFRPFPSSLYLLGYLLPAKQINYNLIKDLGDHSVFVDYNTNLDVVERYSLSAFSVDRKILHTKVPSNFLKSIKSPTVDAKYLLLRKHRMEG